MREISNWNDSLQRATLVHILAAMTWVGGGLMLTVTGYRARGQPGAVVDFARLLSYAGLRIMMPAVILVPITGIWMVVDNSEWSFRQAWVRIALASSRSRSSWG